MLINRVAPYLRAFTFSSRHVQVNCSLIMPINKVQSYYLACSCSLIMSMIKNQVSRDKNYGHGLCTWFMCTQDFCLFMGIIKEQFTLSMLLFHLFMCNPIYEHFWRSQTHCDEFTWYRGGLTKNSSPFIQAENEGNPGNCDGISTRYCCEMEEMLNLVFFFCSSSLKLRSQIL